ncbi:RDD family protein [Streptomyces chumphonensis]|uniref:RDD family protein n=1 Tax=Streptomyces chumphonensis TaxID=1214925 RepID=UPI003D766604
MSAPPSASANGSTPAGYYPDPSIPGYVRYWDGVAWVPGTSRPAPRAGEPSPPPPAGARGAAPLPGGAPTAPPPAPAVPQDAVPGPREETGPVFLDEAPEPPSVPEPGPAPAWRADASRQSGFGADPERVSWGAGPADATDAADAPDAGDGAASVQRPGPTGAPQAAADVRPAAGTSAGSSAGPPVADPRGGWLRAEPAAPVRQAPPSTAPETRPAPTSRSDATFTLRAARPDSPPHPGAEAPPPAAPSAPAPAAPAPAAAPEPVRQPPAGQEQSGGWAQQVRELARPEEAKGGAGPVTPWRPPVSDPFLRAAQEQARPAPLGRRLAARLLDSLVQGALAGAVAAPFVPKALDHWRAQVDAAEQAGVTREIWLIDGTTGGYLAVVVGAFLLFGLLYEALPTARWGRTLGKKVCGVQVLRMAEQTPPGFGAAAVRWLLHGVLALVALGLLNVAWSLFDRPWRQCWHDKAAGTFVGRPTAGGVRLG